jgi:hypothetical protein
MALRGFTQKEFTLIYITWKRNTQKKVLTWMAVQWTVTESVLTQHPAINSNYSTTPHACNHPERVKTPL